MLRFWLLCFIGLVGCASAVDLTAREDPRACVEEVFSTRLVAGRRVADRDVLSVDDEAVRYQEQDAPRELGLADIALVDRDVPENDARELETLRLVLRRDSPSALRFEELRGPLGVGRAELVLEDRPIGTTARLRGALAALAQRRTDRMRAQAAKPTPSAAPDAPEPGTGTAPAKPAPAARPEKLDFKEIEERLEALKDWLQRGLIEQEDYLRERRELLERN